MIPVPHFDAAGPHIPEYESIRAGMVDVFRGIYGTDLYVEPDSQDGQLIAVLSRAIYDTNVFALACVQSYRPGQAQGEALSSLVKNNGISRRVPSRGVVDVVIGGQAGTVIRRGTVRGADQRLWDLPDEVVIPVSGQIAVTATARDLGAVQAPAGTLRTIATPTRGWQTVNNPLAATPGAAVETDGELRARRERSTTIRATTLLEAMVASVGNLPGVTSVSALENDTDQTDANGLSPHSFALVVAGGDAQRIGETIANSKGPGPNTAGTTLVVVRDAFNLTRNIRFYRPTTIPVSVSLTIQPKPGYTTNIGAEIRAAIAEHINDLRDGDDVEYARLWVPANLGQSGGLYAIRAMTVARTGQALAAADVPIPFHSKATCTVDAVQLIVQP